MSFLIPESTTPSRVPFPWVSLLIIAVVAGIIYLSWQIKKSQYNK